MFLTRVLPTPRARPLSDYQYIRNRGVVGCARFGGVNAFKKAPPRGSADLDTEEDGAYSAISSLSHSSRTPKAALLSTERVNAQIAKVRAHMCWYHGEQRSTPVWRLPSGIGWFLSLPKSFFSAAFVSDFGEARRM